LGDGARSDYRPGRLHGRGRNVGTEGRERGHVGGEVGRLPADGRRFVEGQVRRTDAGPATGRITHNGKAGQFGRDGTGRVDRFGGDVAERHLRGGFIVDAVADAAGQLCPKHGGALAELGTEALPAHLQVDAGRTTELSKPDELSDHLVPPLFLLPAGDEEEFRHLVDEQHDGCRAFVVRQTPDVRGDQRIRGTRSDTLPRLDQVVARLHLLHQHGQQLGRLYRVGGQGGEPGRERRQLDATLAVSPDEDDRLSSQSGR